MREEGTIGDLRVTFQSYSHHFHAFMMDAACGLNAISAAQQHV